jgi:hypothetical protein
MEFITNHLEIIIVLIICTGFSYILYSLVRRNKESNLGISLIPFTYFMKKNFLIIFVLTIILCFQLFEFFLHKLSFFIFINCFLMLPILTYIYNYKNISIYQEEDNTQDIVKFKSWDHPNLHIHLMIAIIYPSIWGLYFSLSRYIRMGQTIDVNTYFSSFFTYYFDFIPLIVFTLPHLIFWLIMPLLFFKQLRIYLWEYTSSLLYSFHLKALQFYDYFRLCEIIYKAHFLYFDVFSGSIGATTWEIKNAPYYRQILSFIFYRSYILHIIFFLSIVIELYFTNGILYYGIYTIFIYPFIFSLFRCFTLFGCTQFIKDVCMSDYIYHNFTNPRYSLNFWFYLHNPIFWYGFEQKFHPDLVDVLGRTMLVNYDRYINVTKRSNPLFKKVWSRKFVFDKVAFNSKLPGATFKNYSKYTITGNPHKWSLRIAARYWDTNNVRWFHSSTVLNYPLPNIHPASIFFIKQNPYAILSFFNHPSINFSLIQKVTKNVTNWPKPSEIYKNTEDTYLDPSNTLIDVLEANFVMSFKRLTNLGVIIGTYRSMRAAFGYNNLDTMQMRPDMLTYWAQSRYKYQGYLGIDQKHKYVTNFGRNQVVNTFKDDYKTIISNFKSVLHHKNLLNSEREQVLDLLLETSSDFETHLNTWADSLHLFPDKWKPPLLLNKTFDDSPL